MEGLKEDNRKCTLWQKLEGFWGRLEKRLKRHFWNSPPEYWIL